MAFELGRLSLDGDRERGAYFWRSSSPCEQAYSGLYVFVTVQERCAERSLKRLVARS